MSGPVDPVAKLWAEFVCRFPTEQDCLEELYRRACVHRLLRCSNCGADKPHRKTGGRVVSCKRCKKATYVTSGTFFHHLRIARPWLGAIWLLEHGATISSSRFQKLAGVAYSTAWNIFKKLSAVIRSQMKDIALNAHSSVFSAVVSRRSRETPAGLHPRAEQKKIDSSLAEVKNPLLHAQRDGAKEINDEGESLQLPAEHKAIYDLLKGGATHFDVLCQRSGLRAGQLSSILIFLELDGHVSRQPGDWYVCTTDRAVPNWNFGLSGPSASEGNIDVVFQFIDFIKMHFQGISRKYLQYYLAIFWCHIDRIRWSGGRLLECCMRSGPVRYSDTLSYVTPAITMICPSQPKLSQPKFRQLNQQH